VLLVKSRLFLGELKLFWKSFGVGCKRIIEDDEELLNFFFFF
jgi:hypothetical protein